MILQSIRDYTSIEIDDETFEASRSMAAAIKILGVGSKFCIV